MVVIAAASAIIRSRGGNEEPATEQVHVAVASNFTDAIRDISRRFEVRTGHRVILSFGSTGKHYAQIKNGAPFEAFFAADVARPELLEADGTAVAGSRFTYAFGRLVLWSPHLDLVDSRGDVLRNGRFDHVALANPRLAPYGQAAREAMEALGVWEDLQEKIVRGENIGQTYRFIQSGGAELGFVAYSQLHRPGQPAVGSYWEVPSSLCTPIEQQAVLLKESAVARAFLAFVREDEAKRIIRSYGYGTP